MLVYVNKYFFAKKYPCSLEKKTKVNAKLNINDGSGKFIGIPDHETISDLHVGQKY